MSDYINPDLLSLILKLVPVKNLLRCRIVCKSWKEIVDSKSFIVEHLGLQNPRLIAQNKPSHYLIINPHTLPNFDTLKSPIESDEDLISDEVICSVHGVICIKFNTVLLLWNPSIHRHSTIPLPDRPSPLSCKPCGFWIDPSSNNSKMVIYCPKEKSILLFSSRNQAWTEVARDVEIGWGSFRQVLINGVGHWIAYVEIPCRGVIAYFDFVQERFGTIDLPNELVNEGEITNVCKWQESLSILHWWGYECNVWAMQSESWSKVFTFDLVNSSVRDVLCVEESGRRVLAQSPNGSLVLYDPKIMAIHVGLRSDFIGRSRFIVAYEFVESLVFPDLDFVSCD